MAIQRTPKPRSYTTKIGDDEYTITRLNVMKSFALFPLFAPVVGRILSTILAILKDLGVVREDAKTLSWNDMVSMFDDDAKLIAFLMTHAERLLADVGDILGILKPEDVLRLQRDMFASLLKGNVPMFPKDTDARFEEEFGGDPIRVLRLFIFALRVNYADFSLAVAPAADTSKQAQGAPAVPSQE